MQSGSIGPFYFDQAAFPTGADTRRPPEPIIQIPKDYAMATILVGLLDFDSLHIRSATTDRLKYLSEAVEATRIMQTKLRIAAATGVMKSIFIAPEFMFIREQNETKTAGRALGYDQRKIILEGFDKIALASPSMLIVPGSIVFKVSTVGAGKKAIVNLRNAIKPGEFREPIVTRKAAGKRYERPTLPTFEASGKGMSPAEMYQQQIGTLEEVTNVDATTLLTQPSMLRHHFLIKNRAYVYFDGKRVCSYGKKNNAGERIDDDEVSNSIFIPGKKEGVTTIDGRRIGFEICADHAGGVLKNTLDNISSLDLHVICSGWVDNREYVQNICVKEAHVGLGTVRFYQIEA